MLIDLGMKNICGNFCYKKKYEKTSHVVISVMRTVYMSIHTKGVKHEIVFDHFHITTPLIMVFQLHFWYLSYGQKTYN